VESGAQVAQLCKTCTPCQKLLIAKKRQNCAKVCAPQDHNFLRDYLTVILTLTLAVTLAPALSLTRANELSWDELTATPEQKLIVISRSRYKAQMHQKRQFKALHRQTEKVVKDI